tara:strand:- start:255 stop:515 length:261 start_codon:yes stop_codon:yes gene_type:complete
VPAKIREKQQILEMIMLQIFRGALPMNLLLAVFIPIAILGFLYCFIIESDDPTYWMARVSRNSRFIWNYGIITITSLSIIKFHVSR